MTDVESTILVHKQRLRTMLAIDAVCAVVAVGALYGAMGLGHDWLLGVFFAAVAAGFGAQIWFIVGVSRAKKGV